MMANSSRLLLCVLLTYAAFSGTAQLDRNFYHRTCPKFDITVTKIVKQFIDSDPTVPPGLLRMLFHDAFVRGVDGSVLLNSTDGVTQPEKTAVPNRSLHGFNVIDAIKKELEILCPGVVSCSDILATATRDAIVLINGPFWDVKLGRRDGKVSNAAEVDLPSPFENTNTSLARFAAKGFNADEMVLLKGGGHTIGVGHCPVVQGRLTNFNNTGKPDPTLNAAYAAQLNDTCNADPNAALNQDPVTPTAFDKQYFVNLQNRMGLFTSDEGLFFDSRTKTSVNKYAANSDKFNKGFAKAMQKMSELQVLTRPQGSIRKNCAIAN